MMSHNDAVVSVVVSESIYQIFTNIELHVFSAILQCDNFW